MERQDKLNGKRRKGFTLVEIMVVLILIAALAAIAIPRIAGSKDSAILASMREDARNAIGAENAYYLAYQDYVDVDVDASGLPNGAEATLGSSNIKVVVSPGNHLSITTQTCPDGTKGFTLQVTNSELSGAQVDYDSCNDVSIRVTTP